MYFVVVLVPWRNRTQTTYTGTLPPESTGLHQQKLFVNHTLVMIVRCIRTHRMIGGAYGSVVLLELSRSGPVTYRPGDGLGNTCM